MFVRNSFFKFLFFLCITFLSLSSYARFGSGVSQSLTDISKAGEQAGFSKAVDDCGGFDPKNVHKVANMGNKNSCFYKNDQATTSNDQIAINAVKALESNIFYVISKKDEIIGAGALSNDCSSFMTVAHIYHKSFQENGPFKIQNANSNREYDLIESTLKIDKKPKNFVENDKAAVKVKSSIPNCKKNTLKVMSEDEIIKERESGAKFFVLKLNFENKSNNICAQEARLFSKAEAKMPAGVTAPLFAHNGNTVKGNSGTPLVMYKNGTYQIIALQSSGAESQIGAPQFIPGHSINYAQPITEDFLKMSQ